MIAIWLLLGFAALIIGAEFLVRGASQLARRVGLSPLVIGLTVVAFGTSAPEFAVSVKAGLAHQADIALGNVVGSNIFNVLLILGISALIVPLVVSRQLIRLDVPVMIAASVIVWIFGLNGSISRAEGIILFCGVIIYTIFIIWQGRSRKSPPLPSQDQPADSPGTGGWSGIWLDTGFIIMGLFLLVIGSRWLVFGAVDLARFLGVSELFISLTIIAGGTSLPELATSVVASIRGERDIAVGNVVGSNIFNILAVLGGSAAISGGLVVAPAALRFDIPVMTAVAVLCLPIFFTAGRISRWEGALFLLYYIAYISYLALTASCPEALSVLSRAMFWFVLPASLLGISMSLLYSLRAGSH